MVFGEGGIGKTRLVESLVAEASAGGAAVLVARAFPAEGSIAYAPVVALLRAGFARSGAAGRLAGLPPATLAEVERLLALPDGVTAGVVTTGRTDSPAARARCSRRSRSSSRPSWAARCRASSPSRTCSGLTTRRARRSSTSPGGSSPGRCC